MNGCSCSTKHGPGHFTFLKNLFVWMIWSFSKTFAWAVLSQTQPEIFHGVEKPFRLDVMQPLKHIQVHGWAALPNYPGHGPAHFAALKNHFAWMLCRFSTTFKWTDGRAPPNTFPLISRCWKLFSSGWYEAFQKHSNLWLGRVPPKHGPVPFTVLKNFFVWCYAAM